MAVSVMSAAAAQADSPHLNHDPRYGVQHQPVPLDAPDVALRGQRLLSCGERLCQEEVGVEVFRSQVMPAMPPGPASLRQDTNNPTWQKDDHQALLWPTR